MNKEKQIERIMEMFSGLINKYQPLYSSVMIGGVERKVRLILSNEYDEPSIPPHDNTLDIIDRYERLTNILINQINETRKPFIINGNNDSMTMEKLYGNSNK